MFRFARVIVVATVSLCSIGLAAPASAEDIAAPAPVATQRPKALVPLYLSFAGLQVVDVHSTWRATNAGAVEVNPLLKGPGEGPIGLLAVKAAGTAALVGVTEHLYKRNRTAAVLLMVASNAAMTCVVQHNYRVVP